MATKSPDRTEAGRNWAFSTRSLNSGTAGNARRDKTYGPATDMMLDLASVKAGDRVA